MNIAHLWFSGCSQFNSRRLHHFYSIKSACCKTYHSDSCILSHYSPTDTPKPIKTASRSPGSAFDVDHPCITSSSSETVCTSPQAQKTSLYIVLRFPGVAIKNCKCLAWGTDFTDRSSADTRQHDPGADHFAIWVIHP